MTAIDRANAAALSKDERKSSTEKDGQLRNLGILRAIAVLSVLSSHLSPFVGFWPIRGARSLGTRYGPFRGSYFLRSYRPGANAVAAQTASGNLTGTRALRTVLAY